MTQSAPQDNRPPNARILWLTGILASATVTLLVVLGLRRRQTQIHNAAASMPTSPPEPTADPQQIAAQPPIAEAQSQHKRTIKRLHLNNRMLALLCGIVFACNTLVYAWDEAFDPLLILSWVVSLLAWWVALSETGRLPRLTRPRIRLNWEVALVAALMVIGAVFFGYRLDAVPYDMISDHVEYLMDVVRVTDQGARDIYFANNSGREPLHFYLSAVWSGIFGVSFNAIKFDSALMSVLTLPFIYLFARQLDAHPHRRWTAFFATAFATFCVWHLIMGRMGFRVSFASLAAALLLWLFWRALQTGGRHDFLIVGLVLGFGQYGYTSFRIAPLVILAGVGLTWLQLRLTVAATDRRPLTRQLRDNTLALFLLAGIAFLPLLTYWLVRPGIFWFRTDAMMSEVNGAPLVIAARNLIDSVLMFPLPNIDPVWLNLIDRGAPVLQPIIAALFLLGILVWVGLSWWRRDWRPLLLLAAFVIFLLPSALGIGRESETPSARRAIAALPVMMVFAGSALALPVGWLTSQSRLILRLLGYAVAAGVLVLSATLNLNAYFGTYASTYRVSPQREVATQMQLFIDQGGNLDNVYLIHNVGWIDPRGVALWLGDPEWVNTNTRLTIDERVCTTMRAQPGTKFFATDALDSTSISALNACFPPDLIDVRPMTGSRRDTYQIIRIAWRD